LTYIISAFVIDNLKTQANGASLCLSNIPEHLEILHMHCFSQIPNIVAHCPMEKGPVLVAGGEINAVQLRKQDPV
jgi:hypothetical protein